MERLNPDWITEGQIDFEYKKYILLSYLQKVGKQFNENRLYPVLSDLIFHFKNTKRLKENREITLNQFPKKISKIDLEEFTIEYERLTSDRALMKEVMSIVEFALPRLKHELEIGKEIYEFVDQGLIIEPVGLVPLNKDFGYVFLLQGEKKRTEVYEYQITLFENHEEHLKGIRTEFKMSLPVGFSNTLEQIKFDLIKEQKHLPVPATYVIESDLHFPIAETLLPIAKRKLVRYIYSEAA